MVTQKVVLLPHSTMLLRFCSCLCRVFQVHMYFFYIPQFTPTSQKHAKAWLATLNCPTLYLSVWWSSIDHHSSLSPGCLSGIIYRSTVTLTRERRWTTECKHWIMYIIIYCGKRAFFSRKKVNLQSVNHTVREYDLWSSEMPHVALLPFTWTQE